MLQQTDMRSNLAECAWQSRCVLQCVLQGVAPRRSVLQCVVAMFVAAVPRGVRVTTQLRHGHHGPLGLWAVWHQRWWNPAPNELPWPFVRGFWVQLPRTCVTWLVSWHTATYWDVLQRTATYCNVLQRTTKYYHQIKRTATDVWGSRSIVYVCMYVCMYIYIYTYIFIYVYIYI